MSFKKNIVNKKPRRIHRNRGARLKTLKIETKLFKQTCLY